ncbi:hypothetical protein [Streptomyces poonensis]|uniref:Uncharacterized protein n=1 Tax=Streptomyces poonensis TaxID=68255 RepID=A0A918PEU6_9ACTN|nr:hypothetical protein [Streptomyces poonensis]GGZ03042.1 hypothetical protein GCM10010365_22250 [Streptomyces poonensis]GLJ92944.1 hypothetical protein GCM10017589_55550 [Streptomyces poonensis]
MTEPRIDIEVTGPETPVELPAGWRRELAKHIPKGPWFGMRLDRSGAQPRRAPVRWELTGRPYQGQRATGRADVYLSPRHRGLMRPFVFADGFGHGPSDLPGLWRHLNKPYAKGTPGFLDQLLEAGTDVILLGFAARHTRVQVNAGVAIACIQRAIAELPGSRPLTVGGVSTGGLITRYALAELEDQHMDHRTRTYLSYDTPHNGAWIPLVLQQLAYIYEASLPPEKGVPPRAALLRSPAAQQLLWGWVPDATTSGPVTGNPLREQLMAELDRMGGFPHLPEKLGVANGRGDGRGRPLPPGEVAVTYTLPGVTGMEVRFQPDRGTRQPVGHTFLGARAWHSDTSAVAPFDGAPGGTLTTFGTLTDGLWLPIDGTHRVSCFVPSVSAIALEGGTTAWPDELCTDLTGLTPGRYALDAFRCDGRNSAHGSVSPTLIEWILPRLTE